MEQSTETRRSPSRKKLYRRQALLGWLFSFAVAAIVVYVLFFVWLTPIRVVGGSMEPAFSENQVLLIDRTALFFRAPQRGEVILFDDPAGGGQMLKRIVALPNETIDIKEGRVFIDGCPLDESAYIEADMVAGDADSYTVPENAVYVLGDDRDEGYDSRIIGAVAYRDIRGIARLRILPFEQLTYYP